MTEQATSRPSTPWEKFLFPVHRVSPPQLAEKLSGKTILITGASYGIGEALAAALSQHPCTLVLIARTHEKLKTLQTQWADRPANIQVLATDLREEVQVESLLATLRQNQWEPDIFISNAGHSIYRPVLQSLDRYHDTRRSAAINYLAPVQLLLGVLPALIRKQGQAVNVSTVTQYLPHTPGWSAYYSSKAAFDDWLLCAEPELLANGVSVHHIYLPLVRTRMSMRREEDVKRLSMSAEDAAATILHHLVQKRRKYRPWCMFWPRALHVLLPGVWRRMLVRRLKKKKT